MIVEHRTFNIEHRTAALPFRSMFDVERSKFDVFFPSPPPLSPEYRGEGSKKISGGFPVASSTPPQSPLLEIQQKI